MILRAGEGGNKPYSKAGYEKGASGKPESLCGPTKSFEGRNNARKLLRSSENTSKARNEESGLIRSELMKIINEWKSLCMTELKGRA